MAGDRWVNARITFVVPIIVGVNAQPHVKQEAVADLMDEFLEALPDHLAQNAAAGHWEDVEDGEPIPRPPRIPKPDPADDYEALAAQRDLLLEVIALHARTLDDRALGHPAHNARDRDDIDNDLYSAARALKPEWWDVRVPGLNGEATDA